MTLKLVREGSLFKSLSFNMRRFMREARSVAKCGVLLALALLLSLIPLVSLESASASPAKMMWFTVDTPSSDRNIIVNSSEVNIIAVGSDDRTFYAVDIPNGNLHKSMDGGVTWTIELGGYLTTAGANLPVWNLAVAPDDLNFLIAVTDATGAPGGPRMVFASSDGGASWEDTNITLGGAGEYISCIDISVSYGSNRRDIAVGTRDGAGGGRVYVLRYPGLGGQG